jgi:hypothetical protein
MTHGCGYVDAAHGDPPSAGDRRGRWHGRESSCLGWGVAQHWIIDGFSEVEVSGRGLRSVFTYTREDNVASRGVMSKLGMTYEKTLDDDGETQVLRRLMLDRPV